MRWIIALLLALTPIGGYAQSTAEPVLPGFLTTSGCSGGQLSCFLPYSVSNPLPVTGGGAPSGVAGGDLGGTYPNPTVTSIANVSATNIANNVFVQTVCSAVPANCASVFQFADIRWYGAVCNWNGSTGSDISTVVNTAVASGGVQGAGVPVYFPANCNTSHQLKVLTQNQTWFGPPHQPTYSKFNIAQPYIHVTTSVIAAGAENCVIELNAHQGFTRRSMVFYGDSYTDETSGLCTNTNTTNADGSGQAPIIDDRDVAVMNMGNYIGCPSNITGAAPTGALCGNVYLWHAENVISGYNQNDFTGNGSDPKVKGFIFQSTACDSIWPDDGSHAPSGNWENGRIEAGGFAANCPSATAADAIHINGDRQNFIGVQVETWGGNAYTFDTLYTRPSITNGFVHNVGTDKVSGHQAAFSFNGSNATYDQHTSIQGVRVLADNASPDATHNQLYVVDFRTANNDYLDLVGIGGGTTAYASGGSFFHGTVPAHVNALNADEPTVSQLLAASLTSNGTSLALTETGDSLGQSTLTLENRPGANGIIGHITANDLYDLILLPSSNVQSNIRLEHRNGSVVNSGNATNGEFQILQAFSGFNPGITSLYYGSNEFGYQGNQSKMPAIIDNGPTKFTTSGCSVSATVGGASTGTYTSGTTGTCTVVITINGATGVTAPTGWACYASDRTTPADLITQTASSTTTATLAGTTVSGDVISFGCKGY